MRMMSHFNLSLERGGVGKVQDVRWRVERNADKKLMGWETLITHLTILFCGVILKSHKNSVQYCDIIDSIPYTEKLLDIGRSYFLLKKRLIN